MASARARSSAYVQTPPTASPVISTCIGSVLLVLEWRRELEIGEWQRPIVLDVAELDVMRQVVIERALPGTIVGRPPALRVIRRAGVREERHGLVGPHAVALQVLAPALDGV